MQIINDRRSRPRVPARGSALVGIGQTQVRCQCIDLSAGGVGLLGPFSASRGTDVDVEFSVGGRHLQLRARVARNRRRRDGFLWGLRLDGTQARELESLVAEHGRRITWLRQAKPYLERMRRAGHSPQFLSGNPMSIEVEEPRPPTPPVEPDIDAALETPSTEPFFEPVFQFEALAPSTTQPIEFEDLVEVETVVRERPTPPSPPPAPIDFATVMEPEVAPAEPELETNRLELDHETLDALFDEEPTRIYDRLRAQPAPWHPEADPEPTREYDAVAAMAEELEAAAAAAPHGDPEPGAFAFEAEMLAALEERDREELRHREADPLEFRTPTAPPVRRPVPTLAAPTLDPSQLQQLFSDALSQVNGRRRRRRRLRS